MEPSPSEPSYQVNTWTAYLPLYKKDDQGSVEIREMPLIVSGTRTGAQEGLRNVRALCEGCIFSRGMGGTCGFSGNEIPTEDTRLNLFAISPEVHGSGAKRNSKIYNGESEAIQRQMPCLKR